MAQLKLKDSLKGRAHKAYMYSFGAYKCNRKELQCNCEPYIQEQVQFLKDDVPSWWKTEGENRANDLWPEKPDNLLYKSVRSYHRGIVPWCCYVLVHKSTVPASSLTIQDLPRFYNIDGEPGYCKVPNEWLLGSHYKRSMNDRDFLVLKKEIASALRCVKAVVPTTIVKDCLARSEAELERKVDELKDSGLTATTVKLLIKHHVVEMDKFILHRELPVDKEIQKNSWCIKYLKTALESCGLTVEANYTRCEHSVFGKSSPDFLCVHGDFGKVVQGVFTLDEDNSMDDDGSMDDDDIDDGKSSYNVVGASSSTSAVDAPVQLLGSTTEFKMDAVTERAWAQMFANMARIASILAVNSLEFGYLVSSIWIYGLLTSYDTEKCTPMLYEVNFDDNEAHFYVGKSMNFSDCLALVSLKIRDSCST